MKEIVIIPERKSFKKERININNKYSFMLLKLY